MVTADISPLCVPSGRSCSRPAMTPHIHTLNGVFLPRGVPPAKQVSIPRHVPRLEVLSWACAACLQTCCGPIEIRLSPRTSSPLPCQDGPRTAPLVGHQRPGRSDGGSPGGLHALRGLLAALSQPYRAHPRSEAGGADLVVRVLLRHRAGRAVRLQDGRPAQAVRAHHPHQPLRGPRQRPRLLPAPVSHVDPAAGPMAILYQTVWCRRYASAMPTEAYEGHH